MDWKEYVVPVRVEKDGNTFSFKMIRQFPSNDPSLIALAIKGLMGENAVVDFKNIKTKEQYFKDDKFWKDYVTYLTERKSEGEYYPNIPPEDYNE